MATLRDMLRPKPPMPAPSGPQPTIGTRGVRVDAPMPDIAALGEQPMTLADLLALYRLQEQRYG